MAGNNSGPDITRTTLTVLFIGVLITANLWIIKPFLPSLLWGSAIVVATWPIMLRIQKLVRGRRGIAVAIMTVVLVLFMVVPLLLAVQTISENADMIIGWVKALEEKGFPPPPEWVSRIPMIGSRLSGAWHQLSASGGEGLMSHIAPYTGKIIDLLVAQAGSAGMMLVHLMLTVVVAAILYIGGETAGGAVRRFARRLSGEHGDEIVVLAAKSIQGVALGVVVTALAQSILGGLGLAISGVPAAAVLTAVMFLLCIAQLGPGLVMIPAVVWQYWNGHVFWGTLLLIITAIAMVLDNVLRPFLIKKGVDLPILLILAGVIGGIMAFGIIGLFIGPVVLAVTYELVSAWIDSGNMEISGEP